jgi:hypothetical protein
MGSPDIPSIRSESWRSRSLSWARLRTHARLTLQRSTPRSLGHPTRILYSSIIDCQVRGIAVPSQTILGGRFAIRVCITNHRSELSDFDALVEAVLALGAEMLALETIA